jgi:hypothetical protein
MKVASCLLPCAGYPKLRGAVLLRSGGKKSTISGNNGALEHPYLPQVGGFREPSFGNLEARAAKDKSVAADLPGDVESARLCPGAACYCAAQLSITWRGLH